MSHTFESVVDFFGSDAQIVGGDIVVNTGGKNVEVAKTVPATGVFYVTTEGLDLLDSGKTAKAAKPRKQKAQAEQDPEPTPAPAEEGDAE